MLSDTPPQTKQKLFCYWDILILVDTVRSQRSHLSPSEFDKPKISPNNLQSPLLLMLHKGFKPRSLATPLRECVSVKSSRYAKISNKIHNENLLSLQRGNGSDHSALFYCSSFNHPDQSTWWTKSLRSGIKIRLSLKTFTSKWSQDRWQWFEQFYCVK